MVRLISPNGATVNVDDEFAKKLLTEGYKRPSTKAATAKTSGSSTGTGSTPDAEPTKYDGLKLDELKAEIDERNEDREQDDRISKRGGVETLVAALVADDDADDATSADGSTGSDD